MKDQKIKVGIYTAGSSVKVIGEHDVTTQKYNHREEAIYLVSLSMSRDPSNPISEAEIEKYINTVRNEFRDNKHSFKTKFKNEVDAFIAFNTKGNWTVVRELSVV